MQDKSVSRREFLKLAGIAGATVGLAGGLGSLAAACGSSETTTTTTAPASSTTTIASQTTTTEAASSTTASSTVTTSAETGREIKLGVVMPVTGPLAGLAAAEDWGKGLVEKTLKDGFLCGDAKKHPITILLRDSQSDGARAAQVAGDLILNDKVDILMAGGAPTTGNPVADQAEAIGCPCFETNNAWEAFVLGRGYDLQGKKPMKWAFGGMLGVEQIYYPLTECFEQIPTNKKIAFLAPNDATGMSMADEKTGAPAVFSQYGYQTINAGLYPDGTQDFTEQITAFKKAGCDIVSGATTTPDFSNFWKQSLQQGFHPKVPSATLAVEQPKDVETLGASAINLLGDAGWGPLFPYTDWITGMTCQQLADQYEKDTGEQWKSSIGSAMEKYEFVLDVLKRCTNVDDKEAILQAFKTTNVETANGPLDFTSPVDANPFAKDSYHPYPNVAKTAFGAHQWIKGTTHPLQAVLVSAACIPGNKRPQVTPVVPYVYS